MAALAEILDKLSDQATICALLPLALGLVARYFGPVLLSKKDLEAAIGLRTEKQIEKMRVSYHDILGDSLAALAPGKKERDPIEEHVVTLLSAVTRYQQLKRLSQRVASVYASIVGTIVVGILGFVASFVLNDQTARGVIAMVALVLVIVQVVLFCLLYTIHEKSK